ncbi:hypothetical protein [Desulfosporosinus sp.]|uniref:hypothetical protein n=1 Tax=Desulfosporosinus sp. TaxID=157907 RepID=UPI0023133E6A|nr:hypothetical protein [Desulfosporosinus sp.]MCO5385201.1 hypothetical protein [Desulfosporosinus sp.]MDA8222936.1 hypothetical protein [Desulfitobacterium hafniense]
MARDALATWLDYLIDENEVIPNPSMTNNIPSDDGQFVTIIDIDMTAYRRHKNSKAVKKHYRFLHGLMKRQKLTM